MNSDEMERFGGGATLRSEVNAKSKSLYIFEVVNKRLHRILLIFQHGYLSTLVFVEMTFSTSDETMWYHVRLRFWS